MDLTPAQARERARALDQVLHKWAAWTYGGIGLLGAGSSMLARLIDRKGENMFSGATGSSAPQDGIELLIEGFVSVLAAQSIDRADALRLEYAAGWWNVCERRGVSDYDPTEANQSDRAHALCMSLRSYERKLSEAKKFISERLGGIYVTA